MPAESQMFLNLILIFIFISYFQPSRMRTESEIKVVQKILYRLKCFDRYSLHVKQGLARVIDYDKFEDDRVIVRQGHHGMFWGPRKIVGLFSSRTKKVVGLNKNLKSRSKFY